MFYTRKTLLHVIDSKKDIFLHRKLVYNVPRVDEEIRFGGEGNERFYRVINVIWVYDEPESPYERVNIGVEFIG